MAKLEFSVSQARAISVSSTRATAQSLEFTQRPQTHHVTRQPETCSQNLK